MAKTNKKSIYIGVTIVILIVVLAVIKLLLPGFKSPQVYKNTSIAMGTVISQSVYSQDEGLANSAIRDIQKLLGSLEEEKLSWRIEGSDVNLINQNGSYTVSATTAKCIKDCIGISKNCGGLFDITVGDLTSLWGIGTETAKVPSSEEIKAAIMATDYSQVSIKGGTITIAPGQKLDLGAVGKGLACDEIKNYLATTDIPGAVISVGGSILLYGENASQDDGSWNIGVRDPFGEADDYAAVLNCGQGCVSTSGDYEKVLEKDGVKYHHILNPKTGYPAESNITGVTVVSKSGVISDGLSTACFILGYGDESLALLSKYDSEAIFITKDKKIHITDGLKGKVKLTSDKFSLAD